MLTSIQKWFMIIAMWVGIMFMILVFYWVMVRPGQIRRMCAGKAKQVCEESKLELSNMLEMNRAIYSDCLKSHGVDK